MNRSDMTQHWQASQMVLNPSTQKANIETNAANAPAIAEFIAKLQPRERAAAREKFARGEWTLTPVEWA